MNKKGEMSKRFGRSKMTGSEARHKPNLNCKYIYRGLEIE